MIDYNLSGSEKRYAKGRGGTRGHCKYGADFPDIGKLWQNEMDFGEWHDIVGKHELNGQTLIKIPERAEYYRIVRIANSGKNNNKSKSTYEKERFCLIFYDAPYKNSRKIRRNERDISSEKPTYIDIYINRPNVEIRKRWIYGISEEKRESNGLFF